ncbi:sugar ABC transporter permease [Microbacterium faecale]|uniref:Sugar ABC transporter permease n=2 Tax=Microbacterium faecale TaxID=1804630 RepID=A0A917DCU1_9MICO|nr:sugar ABC transporter permease [Microbacterium faecale]
MLFPFYWMVNSSFAPTGTTLTRSIIPLEPTFDGYIKAFSQQGKALATSATIAVSSVVLCLAISAPAAFAVAHFRLRGIRLILGFILITQMIPGIIVANSLYTLYNSWGLLNSIPGLVLANATTSIPFAVLVMSAYMQALPRELIEAARVDGASYFRAFVSIVLPVSKNAIMTAAIFTFMDAWGDFLFALTLTTTDDVRPVTLSLYNYISSDYIEWNAVMATATLASIPALAFLLFAQKYIAAGTSSGALK